MKKISIFLFLFLTISVVSFFYFQGRVSQSRGSAKEQKIFKIEKGENFLEIGNRLEKEQIIASSLYFDFYVWNKKKKSQIIAGEYEIIPGLTVAEIVVLITQEKSAKVDKKVLTFPEGWTIKKIAARIENNGFNGEKFTSLSEKPQYFAEKYGYDFLVDIPSEQGLEGYLFPDTYHFLPTATEEDIMRKMLDNFNQKLSAQLREEIESQGKSIHEIITMASIVENEVRTDEDRRIVSGLFWNRISVGQALQSSAPLTYILGENKRQYSYADTRIDSPYNTYLYPGLPPGPISSPGLSAIEATIYPAETDYNYFLNNPETGETFFARTLDEHNSNKVNNGL